MLCSPYIREKITARDSAGRAGDPLDFWRVEAWEEPRLLRLGAEMKVPGRAWLQFEVEPAEGGSRITQTAVLDSLNGRPRLLVRALADPLVDLRADAARSGGDNDSVQPARYGPSRPRTPPRKIANTR